MLAAVLLAVTVEPVVSARNRADPEKSFRAARLTRAGTDRPAGEVRAGRRRARLLARRVRGSGRRRRQGADDLGTHPGGLTTHADAALHRARLAIERGRFALAEEALAQATFPRRSPAGEMSESYRQQLYLLTGRLDELRRSIEGEWGGPRSRAEVLRTRWLADDASSSAIDAVERRLDEAGRAAPEDDRVWLGRAYLAIRKEQFDEAGMWLKKCLARRPEDPVVWRARLEWATASGNVDEAAEAMRHVPIGSIEPEQILTTRAWLAARLGDEARRAGRAESTAGSRPGRREGPRAADRSSVAGRP